MGAARGSGSGGGLTGRRVASSRLLHATSTSGRNGMHLISPAGQHCKRHVCREGSSVAASEGAARCRPQPNHPRLASFESSSLFEIVTPTHFEWHARLAVQS